MRFQDSWWENLQRRLRLCDGKRRVKKKEEKKGEGGKQKKED